MKYEIDDQTLQYILVFLKDLLKDNQLSGTKMFANTILKYIETDLAEYGTDVEKFLKETY
jgi:hypothetical protein